MWTQYEFSTHREGSASCKTFWSLKAILPPTPLEGGQHFCLQCILLSFFLWALAAGHFLKFLLLLFLFKFGDFPKVTQPESPPGEEQADLTQAVHQGGEEGGPALPSPGTGPWLRPQGWTWDWLDGRLLSRAGSGLLGR